MENAMTTSITNWQKNCPREDRNTVWNHVFGKLSYFFPGEHFVNRYRSNVLEEKAFGESYDRNDYLWRVATALSDVENVMTHCLVGTSESAGMTATPWQPTCSGELRLSVYNLALHKLRTFYPGVGDTALREKASSIELKEFTDSWNRNDYLWHVAKALTRIQNPASDRTEKAKRNKIAMCEICCDEKRIPSLKLTSSCNHERQVCCDCVQMHIKVEVGKGRLDSIMCIAYGCDAVLDYEHVRQYADSRTFETYDRALMRRALQKDTDFVWCSRPGCESGQLHVDRAGTPIMICRECNAMTCVRHRSPWHDGRTCEEHDVDITTGNEAASLRLLDSSRYRRCPSCRAPIEKNGGCNHMVCQKRVGGCGAEFCWLCLALYTGPNGIRKIGNKAHKRTCPFYR